MATWLQSLGNLNNSLTDKFMAGGIGKGLSSLGVTSGGIGGIANTIGQIGTGLLAGQNQTGVGNALQTIGGLASNIPGVGGLIGAGVGVVGGLVNAAFGSHINDEFVQQTQLGANQVGSQVFNANTNGDLLNDWQNMTQMSNVSKSEVGSDGWFSSAASDKTDELNRRIDEANKRQLANFNLATQKVDDMNDLRILQNMAAYGGPINSFRKYYAEGGLFNTPQFFTFEPQTYDKGGYLNQAKALIRQNEGWRDKPYSDAPKGKNWRSVGYGFNDSGFRDKYPEGISKHYEHGITKKQAEEELDYFLNKAEKQLKSIYGKQWNDFTDSQKAAILDTYYQRPASVGKSSRFYKAVTAGEDAGRYLGVAGYNKRNKVRQGVFGGGYSGYGDWSNTESDPNPSTLQEVTPFTPVVHDLDLSGITPTEAKALELNLTSPTFDLSIFGKPMTAPIQQAVPTVGTVEDFLASYGNFEENLFKKGGSIHIKPSHRGRLTELKRRTGKSEAELYNDGNPAHKKMVVFARNARKWKHEDGGKLNIKDMNIFDFGGGLTHGSDWDTGINWVNEGGSHGENPLGGVQMGVDEQGVPNLVEEGEAIWNGDYVFSKRMKVPKKLAKKYGLGGDMTFADAIAKLTKDSEERPLSNIDRATNDHILGEFADSQEELRMAKAQRAMDKEIQLQDDFLTGFQFGLGGHMSPLGIVPDADNTSIFEKVEQLYADGGDLFTNPFAYGGAMGNVFEGKGSRPNVLTLDNRSFLRRMFGDNGFVDFMENTTDAINDPIGYFAGDQIDAIMNRVAQMSEPQLEKFFSTPIGQRVAGVITSMDSNSNPNVQEAGVQRWAQATGRMARPVQRAVVNAARRAMAQSRQAAKGQMKTPKGGGKQKVLTESSTPVQSTRQAITGSTEGLPQGWNLTRGNTPTMTTESIVQGPNVGGARFSGRTAQTSRVNPKSSTGRAATSRGTTPDPYAGLEGTLDINTPFASGNFGYLPWIAGAGAGGYGVYKGIDWLSDNLKTGQPEVAAAFIPTSTRQSQAPASNRGNVVAGGPSKGNRFLASGQQVPTSTASTRGTQAAATSSGSAGTRSAATVPNRGNIVDFAYDWYRNGSDGYSTPTGFKVGDNGRAYDYTQEYRDLVNSLGADDIRKWAAKHPNDPSLKSFLARGNKLEDLTNKQWRKGATDGKYGFMHHVADQIGKEQAGTRAMTDEEFAAEYPMIARPTEKVQTNPWTDGSIWSNVGTTRSADTPETPTTKPVTERTSFKPKQTWTRNLPWMMSGIMGLKEMLTPADYGNADAIMAAAYQAGSPISVGTEYVGDYRRRDPFDERYLMNIINQNRAAANRNMMNFSGGNRAIGMAGILTNDLTSQMSLAEAARQSYLANRADDAQVSDFNYRTNKGNADAQNQRNLTLAQLNNSRQGAMLSGIAQGARLRQAIKDQRDAAISANLTNFAQGLGDLGKENGYYNMLGGLNEEGILKYFYGDDWKTKFNNVNV